MTVTNSMSESQLIEGLKNSSEAAFNAIYDKYARRLLAFCHQYTKSMEEAEDIVQEVFVKLWNSRYTIKQEQTIMPLLFTMSRNQLINAYRKTVNSPVFEEFTEYHNSKSTSDDSSNLVEYDEFVKRLHFILDSMPTTQRQVIELTRFQGKTNKEAADILNLSEQTVKNQVSMGLKTLRKELLKFVLLLWLLSFVN